MISKGLCLFYNRDVVMSFVFSSSLHFCILFQKENLITEKDSLEEISLQLTEGPFERHKELHHPEIFL